MFFMTKVFNWKFKCSVLLSFILLTSSVVFAQTDVWVRKIYRDGKDLHIEYICKNDTLKGFFEFKEEFNHELSLKKKEINLPYKLAKSALVITGDRLPLEARIHFVFKAKDEQMDFRGSLVVENYPASPLVLTYDLISVLPEPKVEPVATLQETKKDTTHIQKKETNNTPVISEVGIHFRVQLAASTRPMDKSHLKKLTGMDIDVKQDFIDGYYKYTIGQEKSVQEATQLLRKLNADNFKNPFIVAYEGDKRITVQQALLKIKEQ